VVSRCDALAVGRAAVALGAGRQRKEDSVDHAVSIELLAKVGDEVAHGDALARIGYNDTERFEAALPLLTAALGVGVEADPGPLIIGEVR
jgi:thymidine phosphorylase